MERFKKCLEAIAFDPRNAHRACENGDQDEILIKMIDPFVLDQMKVIQSKAYRRLTEKTQVFYQRGNQHVRTRAIHTMEVYSLAVVISDFLGLNTELTRAMALAHDIGHTPYGHVGERFISEMTGEKFSHNSFGVVVATEIEREGAGLNLTSETLMAIKHHSGYEFDKGNDLPECSVVRISDKICNTFSDLNDALRFGYLDEIDLPICFNEMKGNQRERIGNCLSALFEESYLEGKISFSCSKVAKSFKRTTEWMYENIYPRANNRIMKDHLVSAYHYLRESPVFDRYHAPTVFALMTESEVERLWLLYENDDLDPKKIKGMGIMEIIGGLVK